MLLILIQRIKNMKKILYFYCKDFKLLKNMIPFFLIISISIIFYAQFLPACEHVVITGSGIVACIESLVAYQDSALKKTPLRITIFEKNVSVHESTATHIAPSLTPDEIVSVVPRGQALLEKSRVLFSQPGGIRVDDVQGVHGSLVAEKFMHQADQYSLDEIGHAQRTQDLLSLGKMSMEVWQKLYENADDALQEIFRASNFNPCRQSTSDAKRLHDGYRIDLISNVADAQQRALAMKADYESLGYDQCAILTPAQVIQLDPSLAQFCKNHTMIRDHGDMMWHNDTVALWRPGGCLDASVFIPRVYAYLQEKMGNNFTIHCEHKVIGVAYENNDREQMIIAGLQIADHATFYHTADEVCTYVFCPGEAVGTLHELGFAEPAYAGFAGAALKLIIDIPAGYEQQVAHFNHCMEVHQEGIVLAWQARLREDKIFIAVAGTKAFYADQTPHKDQAFAVNRNILQLNMINNVLPEFVSWAFGYDTTGVIFTEQDLNHLEIAGIAQRWVGVRAVAYDGFPTLGRLYKAGMPVANARCITHLGSGGVSFAPAVTLMSRAACDSLVHDEFTQRILECGSSLRTA